MKNLKKFLKIIIILTIFIHFGCRNDDIENKKEEPITIVYTAGYFLNDDGYDMACYWINQDEHILERGRANSIYVYGEDIYVAGYYYTGNLNDNPIACYWKNGEKVLVSVENSNIVASEIRKIKFYGKDIYCVGIQNNKACYWKNGVRTDLPSNDYVIAEDLAILDKDIHVVGNDDDDESFYWVNNIRIDLENQESTQATAVAIYNNEVYIGGFKTGWSQACYWKNNKIYVFDNNTYSSCYDLIVDQNGVIMAGSEYTMSDTTGYPANFFKSQTEDSTIPIQLTEDFQIYGGCFKANTFNSNDHIYSAGYYYDSEDNKCAFYNYYQNGDKCVILHNTSVDSKANDIFLVEKEVF